LILTLTPNPSLDLLFTADTLVWDDANRIAMPRQRPGGQGVNLIRALRVLDPRSRALAVIPLGGKVGREMRSLLEAEGSPVSVVPIAGETRLFVGVRERDSGRSLLLNPRGSELRSEEADALLHTLDLATRSASSTPAGPRAAGASSTHAELHGWVLCCGSTPPGLEADFYARAGALARERRFRFVADCDGDALTAAVPYCDLLVPNAHEATRLTGIEVTDPPSALRAATRLREIGTPTVAVTLGEAGAVGVADGGAWWSRPVLPADAAAEVAGGSAVGAGDAFLAAMVLEADRGAGLDRALERAVAAGTAVLLGRGADLIRRRDVDRILPCILTEPIS
jgi:fructose-1-phosphate kinase PfkB-like protein